MADFLKEISLPEEQRAIQAKCFHPSRSFVEFGKEEIEQSIPDRFEQQVRKYSDRIAVKTRTSTLTYDALNKMANRVARAILAQRGEREEPVALFLDHDAAMMAAILGVLKAGKICVPLDPSYPEKRTNFILEDSQAALILTNNKNLSLATGFVRNGLRLVNLNEIHAHFSTDNLGAVITPDTLAYIVYTSGSTGRPKGVTQNHRNILHNALRYTNGLHICADDRVTLLASLGTGQGVPTAFCALLNGATLCPLNIKEDGVTHLAEWLIAEGITVYISASTIFRHFLDTLTGKETFPSLRLIKLVGEPVSERDVEAYNKHFSSNSILMVWLAATETGTVRRYFINKETRINGSIVPVGYAIEDKEILLLDEAGKELGFNQVGEIAVRSRYLSLGYWRRPDLTQAKFLPDPNGGNKRTYLTGDLGLMLPDGCLMYLGRKDSQVKVRGYRVEVEEVEMALLELAAIKEAVVMARKNDAGETCLVAYLVPNQQPAPSVRTIRRALAEKLPDYMLPSAFVMRESFPVTPTGKVDRRALPAPVRARPELTTPFGEPGTPTEAALVKIWAEVLGLDQVGIHDNFFDLGGHSLLAARMFAEIQKVFGKKLPLSALFHGATIQHLASIISQPTPSNGSSSLVAIQPRGSRRPFFCIHELFGDVLCYANLARHLGQDQPFYALQARGLDGTEEPFTDIAAMAAHYIEEIRPVQPQGPYALGGLCSGGIVAFEMAQQLRAKGEAVAMVALLDSPAANSRHGKLMWWWSFLRNFPRDLPSWLIGSFELNRAQWATLVKQKISMTQASLRYAFRSSRDGSHQNGFPVRVQELGDLFHFSEQHRKVAHAQYRAFREYSPQIYPGRLTLFRARMQPLFSSHAPDKGWGQLAVGGLEIKIVPGNHLGMLQEPHVQVLAEQLRACLDESQRMDVPSQTTRIAHEHDILGNPSHPVIFTDPGPSGRAAFHERSTPFSEPGVTTQAVREE